MQASFSGQPHRHLQVTVRLRLRLTVFQEEAFHPAAGVLCLGHCCRLVSPDASSTSISYDAVHGRRRLYMLGGSLVPIWSVSAGRQHCYTGPEPQGPNLQIDSHIDITSLLLTSLHSYSSHVFVLE